jgi:hypothetical protein
MNSPAGSLTYPTGHSTDPSTHPPTDKVAADR